MIPIEHLIAFVSLQSMDDLGGQCKIAMPFGQGGFLGLHIGIGHMLDSESAIQLFLLGAPKEKGRKGVVCILNWCLAVPLHFFENILPVALDQGDSAVCYFVGLFAFVV